MTRTIVAVSTTPGVSGVAVVRVSGPDAGAVIDRLAGRRPSPRFASLRTLRDPLSGEPLDQALVLWFPSPRSFTGEDMAELHVHGGRAVVASVLAAVLRAGNIRPAEAGEFTRRAFENGKLDLAQIEGLSDLLKAETEGQRRQAFRIMAGALTAQAESIRSRIVPALALLEAAIDFPDEDDVAVDAAEQARKHVMAAVSELDGALNAGERGERVRDGMSVVIVGAPNAGKSTLLNAIAGRDAAIVSPDAGTTRDLIEVHLDLGGQAVAFVDTAGLREGADRVEAEGVRRALARAAQADLVLWLDPTGRFDPPYPKDEQMASAAVWPVVSQVDRSSSRLITASARRISAVTGEGLATLLDDVKRFLEHRVGGETAVVVRTRHRAAFAEARHSLAAALLRDDWSSAPEVVAQHVRDASDALGRISGRVDVEAVLDLVFSEFCIGK